MYILKEAVSPNGKSHALMIMMPDGSVEGRIYRPKQTAGLERTDMNRCIGDYELCASSDKLSSLEAIVYEELGL